MPNETAIRGITSTSLLSVEVISAVAPSMIEAEQDFSFESAIARSTF